MENTDRPHDDERSPAPRDEQEVDSSMERADVANGEVPDDEKEERGAGEAAKPAHG